MKRTSKIRTALPAACAAAAAAFALGAAGGDAPGGRLLAEAPRISRVLALQMPAAHVRHHDFDAALAPAAWTNFIDSLDFDHVYFTQEDLDEFAPFGLQFDRLLAAGETNFPKRVFDRFVQRVAERRDFVAAAVSNDWDFAEPDAYVWRRRKEPRPADLAAQDELWTRRVKNALLAARIRCEIANENA